MTGDKDNKQKNQAFIEGYTNSFLITTAIAGLAGLGVGIALAPVIAVPVAGVLGFGAVGLASTAIGCGVVLASTGIGAGIGAVFGYLNQPSKETQEENVTPQAARDLTKTSSDSQEEAQNTQRESTDRHQPRPAGSNNAYGAPSLSDYPLHSRSAAGGRSQATLTTLAEQSKVTVTERLQQATQIKEVDASKSSVAALSPSPSTQVREVDIKTGEQEKTGAALGSVTGDGGKGVADGNSSQVLQKTITVALEISTGGPTTKLTVDNHIPQKPDVTETPPGPDNSPALQSSPPPLDLVGGTDAPKPPSTSPANSATNTGANKSLTLAQGLDSGQANNP